MVVQSLSTYTLSIQWNPALWPPFNTVTSLLWPLFLARQNSHTFAYKKTPLMLQSPVNTANGHFFKFPTHIILIVYNLTPLIRQLKKAKTPYTNQTASFLNFHYRALTATAAVCYLNCKAILKIIVIYDKCVDNKVFWLSQLQSRTTPGQSFFVINMACFFLAVCFFVCGSL